MTAATDKRDHVDALSAGETLIDLLRKRERNLELRLHVSAPGVVESYDPITQTANVRLGFIPVEDKIPEDPLPAPIVIPRVRVRWPRTAAAYDTWPLTIGDTGQLFFTDRAIEEWHRRGGAVDPIDARTHSLADAVFYPGLAPDDDVITPPPAINARVIECSQIKLGRSATSAVTKAEELITALDAAITAAIAGAAAQDGGTAALTAFQTSWNAAKNTIKAAKGQAE